MKHKLLFLIILLLVAMGTRGQTLLQQESFEADGAGSRYTTNGFNTNTVGGTATQNRNQYFQRVTQTSPNADPPPNTLSGNGSSTASWYTLPVAGGKLDGSYFFAGEGVRGPGNTLARDPGTVTLNTVSIAGKTGLQVQVAMLDGRGTGSNWTPNTSTARSLISIQVNIDNTGWNTVGQFAASSATQFAGISQDTNYDGVGDGTALTTTFQDFTFPVSGSGNTMQTRVVADVNGLSTEFGFDNIRVLGTTANGAAPLVANIESTALAYAEGAGTANISNTITVSDGDSPSLNGATVKFTNGGIFDSSEDLLVFINQNGITGSYNTGTGVLTMSGSSSVANYQAALRSVQYQNSDVANATAGNRVVSFQVTDNTSLASGAITRTITVTTALDAAGGLPYAEDLETNGEGTRYASNNTTAALTSGRAFLRTNITSEPGGQWHSNGSPATTISGINTSNYWWASGTNVLSNGVGTFMTKPINTAGYTNLTFSVKLAASNNVWENAQYVKVYYRIGGSTGTWTPLISFRSTDQVATALSTTGNLARDADPATTTGVPTGAQLTPALTTYSASLPTSANGQLVDVKIDALSRLSDGVGEVIAFDNLQLVGTPTTTVNSIVRSSTTPTNAASVNYTVTFGTPVTGLTAANFSLTSTGSVSGATVGTPTAGSGTTWTVPVGTGTGSGTLTLTLINDTNLSSGLSTSLPFAGETYTIDRTAPAAPVVTIQANGSIVSTTTPTYAGTAEARSTVTVIIDGSTLGTTTANSAGNWAITQPTALAQGSHTVRARATDAVGNSSVDSNINTFTVDSVRPSVAISSTAGASGSSTSSSPIPYTVTFSEAVTGFVAGDVTVTNGTVSGFSGSGTTYSINVTPSANGLVSVSVPANVAQDQAGNGNTAATTYAITFQAPTIVVAPATLPGGQQGTAYSQTLSGTGGTAPYTYAITAGALPAGLSLASGTIAGTPTANGTFTFTVTATDASAAPGPYAGSRSYSLTIAPQPVTAAPVVIVPSNGSIVSTTTPTYGGTAPANSSIQVYVDGLALPSTTTANSAGNWAITQPTALSQGSRTVYATAQTNGSTVSANSNTNPFTVDSVRPTVAISSTAGASGSSTSSSPIPFAVSFSEAVTGFVAGDLTVTGGSISGFSGSGTTYSVNVTPSANGLVSVSVPANVAQDVAGNGNTAASQYSLTFQAPTIAVSPAALPNGQQGTAYSQTLSASAGTAPYTFAITAGALPPGLSLTSGTIAGTPTANGTFTFAVTATDASAAPGPYSGSRSYSLTIAPQPVTAAPVVTTPAGGALVNTTTPAYGGTALATSTITVYVDDANIGTTTATGAGNWTITQPTALTQGSHQVRATAQLSGQAVSGNSTTNTFTVDSVRPTVAISSTAGASGSSTSSSPIPFAVSFSEPVTGFVAADLTVSGGAITEFAGSGTSYTVVVTPAADGLITVEVPANVAQDGANNGNTASSVFSIIYSRPVTATPLVVTPANGSVITSTKPTYAGTATALASLSLIIDDNTAAGLLTTANASGNWTITPLTDLAPGAHTVQARAQLGGQTASAYSPVNSFTLVVSATVVTATPAGVTSTSATLGGSVTDAGAGTISERGVVYLAGIGTPTTSDTKVAIGAGTGSFAQAVTGLTASTTYAVRAYAINQAGTSYGTVQVVSTGNALAITSVTPSAVCAGATISVAYTNSSPGTTLQLYLNGPSTGNQLLATLNASQAGGTITATIPADRLAGQYSVYLSGAGASSGSVNVTVNAIPSTPTTSPVTVCQNTTPVSLAGGVTAAQGASLNWYTAPTGGTASASAPVPPTSTVGQTTYYVSQVVNGCESGRAALTYTVNALPVVTLTNDGPLSCTRPAVTLTADGAGGVPGRAYRFSGGATQIGTSNSATVSLSGVYSVTVTDGNGCSVTNQTTVGSDQSNPQAGLTNDGPLTCAQPTVTLTAAGSGSYRFSAGAIQIGTGNTATVTTSGVYSVTVTAPNGCSATAQTTVELNSTVAAPTLTASALSTENAPISVTASGCSGSLNWTVTGGSGTVTGSVYTISQPGNYTLTATCTVGNCTSPAAPSLALQIRPGGFAIKGIELVRCQLVDAGRGQYEISFTPQYSGLSGSPVSFGVVNELAATTAPGPYTLRLYTDNPAIALVATQAQAQATYRYNWLVACNGTQPPPNRPPVAQPIPDQVLVVGQPYQLDLSGYFTDPDGQALTFTATGLPAGLQLSGTRLSGSPTQAGTVTVQLTALDPGGLQAGSSVLLRVDPAPVTPTSGVFSLAGVTGVRCETLSVGERQLSFSPVYTGLTGAPVSFGIPNELAMTTAPGPYSLKLYTDNPAITLTATQNGTPASYRFSWLAACPTGTTTPPAGNRPPAVGTGLGNQTAQAGQGYTLFITAGTFTDPDNDPLQLSVSGLPAGLSFSAAQQAITGTPAQAGSSSVQVTATDPGGLSVSTSFVLTVQPATTPTPTPGAFSIAGVTGVRCETLSVGERQLSFSPVYTGVTGEPIRFGVVNELATTTAPGPYTLRLYTDNPTITLTATQGSAQATYRYSWLTACPTNANGRQAVVEAGSQLSVVVLGNPVVGESVEVLIGGVEGQAVEVSLSDVAGHRLHQQQIPQASGAERVIVPVSAGQAMTILKVSTASQHRSVKLIRH